MEERTIKIALIGNPNTGKSSLFNQLTGLNQKVGNYPGITVDKKIGYFNLSDSIKAELIDLPGTYSLYPRSRDEELVMEVLSNPLNEHFPDLILVIADATNLRRNLLVFEQIKDLGLPTMLIVNMIDELEKSDVKLDLGRLKYDFNVEAIATNARKGKGINELKEKIIEIDQKKFVSKEIKLPFNYNAVWEKQLKEILGLENPYLAWHWVAQPHLRTKLTGVAKQKADDLEKKFNINIQRLISQEIINRYNKIDLIIDECIEDTKQIKSSIITDKIDQFVLHKTWGFFILIGLLLVMFQSIFSWASGPMDLLDNGLAIAASWLGKVLPDTFFANLITQGIIPGISGILIFIPQIALLFLFIALFEESGYMARVVFLMDKLLRPFGLSGKSVVPLISGYACAIPAIMATRSIENWRERLSTLLVVPFMTCSARLPVYTILIALIVPASVTYFGFLSAQALLLLFMYVLAAATALFASLIVSKSLKLKEDSFLIMELPNYKLPRLKNVLYTMYEKTKSFVFGAGKIILSISIVIWLLSSFGPNDKFYNPEKYIDFSIAQVDETQTKESKIESYKLEHSFIGYLGKAIEPAIKPLGYDWKIGIALLTSFAAREVFVGTIATIYSIDATDEETTTIKQKMQNDIDSKTGKPRFGIATSLSLLIFYAFAMQCMSTIAIVKRETKSWAWPIGQAVMMTLLAYLLSFVTYQTFA